MTTPKIHDCECEICQGPEEDSLKEEHYRMNLFLSRLDEQQRRWYAALEAEKLGHGGIEIMAKITGLHVNTISRGRKELGNDLQERPPERVRVKGGGRKAIEKKKPEVEQVLEQIVSDEVAGLPTSSEKWVRKSVRKIASALKEQSYEVGRTTVGRLLRKLDYGLVSNRKSLTGTNHPDQDRQFRYLRRVKRLFLEAGLPVISVDTKNKELIGHFFNKGQTWRQATDQVHAHDFRQDASALAVPYGIYDLTHNQGFVYVGTSYDTSEFAAYCIAQWWADPERPRFEREDKLLILCDAGGSNSCRYWLWKQEVQQQLANQFGLEVMICHYPTGNSKYNPIEYRLFSQISINWAGQPLRSLQTMLNFIQGTTTTTGLKVSAFLVDRLFEKGRKVSQSARNALNLVRRSICPLWNYIIRPQPLSSIPNP